MISGHITIYVEGGSKGALATECRKGFNQFFGRAGLTGHMPKVLPCGPRVEAFKNFCMALKNQTLDEFPLLLVDSEGPVTESPWQHVLHRVGDEWKQPDGAVDAHLHFMTQVMESWFLADRAVLIAYFGSEFKESKLPVGNDLQAIPKLQVFEGLKAATKECGRVKTYHKGRHSFEILGRINPDLVAIASPHAKRFLSHLKQLVDAGSQGESRAVPHF